MIQDDLLDEHWDATATPNTEKIENYKGAPPIIITTIIIPGVGQKEELHLYVVSFASIPTSIIYQGCLRQVSAPGKVGEVRVQRKSSFGEVSSVFCRCSAEKGVLNEVFIENGTIINNIIATWCPKAIEIHQKGSQRDPGTSKKDPSGKVLIFDAETGASGVFEFVRLGTKSEKKSVKNAIDKSSKKRSDKSKENVWNNFKHGAKIELKFMKKQWNKNMRKREQKRCGKPWEMMRSNLEKLCFY